jgi:hypothetical protein
MKFRMSRRSRQFLERFVLLVLLPILIPCVALYVLISLFATLVLYVAVFAFWLPRGKDTLFVYSNSPHWKEYIELNILPAVGQRCVVLNWSERGTWRQWSLAVSCFRHFGGGREFNPMAVVFRRFRRAKVFRFWRSLHEFKHGNPAPLFNLQAELFGYLGLQEPDRQSSMRIVS